MDNASTTPPEPAPRPALMSRIYSSMFGAQPAQSRADDAETEGTVTAPAEEPKKLTFYQLMVVLRPFFWPAEGTDGALVNRIRAVSTWFMVGASKACSLISPLFLLVAVSHFILQLYPIHHTNSNCHHRSMISSVATE
jgi:hypothetical protein